MANENSNVVVDRAQSHWSDLWKKEDYWAIWLGFALLIAAICIFINGAPASYKETIDKSNLFRGLYRRHSGEHHR